MSLSERSLNTVNQNVLGLVALLVSLVALLTTVLQVLQQYFSSAEGYRRCAESVMGLWYKGTHRKLRFHEFRFEVVFETPVIFVAPPDNKRGPISGRDIHYIDGTPESYKNTRVLSSEAQDSADQKAIERVHTADDERASWLTLLSVLQRKEKESREWDERERCEKQKPPRGSSKSLISPPQYGLTVGLQSKTRSWDFMPAAITKPYATSAICHLVEMMSMLGIYWKVFDQELWNLRAEGNGHILTSTQVHGLGLMVTFAVTGKSKFQENRVIPHDALKSLAFGTVPNIFDNTAYQEANVDARTIDLQFGEPEEVAHTLESLGCSPETIQRYQKDHKHIFSVSFEIVAMLAQVFRIRGSNFRMIPNPTADNWLKNPDPRKASWKITLLMQLFQGRLAEFCDGENFSFNQPIITTISDHWVTINREGCAGDDAKLSIETKEAIHNAIDDVDKYLLQDVKQADYINVLVSHLDTVIEILSDARAQLNSLVLANKEEPFMRNYFDHVLPRVRDKPDAEGVLPSDEEKELRTTIWLTLIFRMLCWLLLHDFDSHDVKRVPSDLKGSRMPIFIG